MVWFSDFWLNLKVKDKKSRSNTHIYKKKIDYLPLVLMLLLYMLLPDPNNRVAPSEPPRHGLPGFTITPARLAELRSNFLYWFFDQGGNNDRGDYQKDIHASMPQLHKNFNFQLPFFGFRFNYTRVSVYDVEIHIVWIEIKH